MWWRDTPDNFKPLEVVDAIKKSRKRSNDDTATKRSRKRFNDDTASVMKREAWHYAVVSALNLWYKQKYDVPIPWWITTPSWSLAWSIFVCFSIVVNSSTTLSSAHVFFCWIIKATATAEHVSALLRHSKDAFFNQYCDKSFWSCASPSLDESRQFRHSQKQSLQLIVRGVQASNGR